MAVFSNQNFTTLTALNTKGTIAFRFAADVIGNESTLRVKPSLDTGRAWDLPDKSGTFPVTGTFTVNLPAVTSFAETAVTVSGIRREDTLICQVRDMVSTVTTGRTFPFIVGARPENGYIYLTFYNPTGTATLYGDMVVSYTTAR